MRTSAVARVPENTGSMAGCCIEMVLGPAGASPHDSSGCRSGRMRSHSSVVSSGYIEKLTLNGTFANASANRAPAGSENAGLAPRTNAIGTAPARICSTAARTSATRGAVERGAAPRRGGSWCRPRRRLIERDDRLRERERVGTACAGQHERRLRARELLLQSRERRFGDAAGVGGVGQRATPGERVGDRELGAGRQAIH